MEGMTQGPSTSASRDKASWELNPSQWVEAHGDVLFGYAMIRLRDREIAEDLVQDCLLGAFESRHRFTGKSAERTWLVGILKHKIVDHLRKRSRRDEPQVLSDESAGATHFDKKGLWGHKFKGWDQDPQALAQDREFQATLSGCLSSLPDKLATTFVLCEIDGIETKEVCTILGITSTNLWARIHRARLSMRRCLELKWFNA